MFCWRLDPPLLIIGRAVAIDKCIEVVDFGEWFGTGGEMIDVRFYGFEVPSWTLDVGFADLMVDFVGSFHYIRYE